MSWWIASLMFFNSSIKKKWWGLSEESAWEFLNLRVPVCISSPAQSSPCTLKKPYPLLLNPQICPPGKAQGAPWAPWSNLTNFSWENHGTLELIIVIYIVGNSTGKSWFNQVYCRKRPVIFASPWGMGWSSIYLWPLWPQSDHGTLESPKRERNVFRMWTIYEFWNP